MNIPMIFRRGLWLILAMALSATLYLNFQTASAVFHSQTNVLSRDQWWFLGELQSLAEGEKWWHILWSPYWGHRPVFVRLLFYLDARLFAFRSGPLLSLTWWCLAAEISLLISVNWALFKAASWRFLAALIVLLSLSLSPLQMENLIWALQIQYILVFFCAVLSLVSFSLGENSSRRKLFLGLSCFSALVGSLSMAQGLFIWPVLAMQAYLCGYRRKLPLGLLTIFGLLAGLYALHYDSPGTGMGLSGLFQHPLHAIEISLMVVAGSISNRSLFWGVAAGGFGVLSLGVFLWKVKSSDQPAWPSVYVCMAVFLLATASLTAAGRISPELLKILLAGHHELLPSRYQTFGYVFWISLFTLALWFTANTKMTIRSLVILPAILIPLFVVVEDGKENSIYTTSWSDAMHSVDATGMALLVNVIDWEREQILWSERSQLVRWIQFARDRKLANFSDPNSGWLQQSATHLFRVEDKRRCEGRIESSEHLANSGSKLFGWAWDRQAESPPRDLIFVDSTDRVIGLARGGVAHHDVAGHSSQVLMHQAGWLGYSGASQQPAKGFVVLRDGRSICELP